MLTGLVEIFESMPIGTKIAVITLFLFCFGGMFYNKGNTNSLSNKTNNTQHTDSTTGNRQ